MFTYLESLPARILLLTITYGLIGGGSVVLLGVTPPVALDIIILPLVVGGAFGIALGIDKFPGPTVIMTAGLPFSLLGFVVVFQLLLYQARSWGWTLLAAGALPLAELIALSMHGSTHAPPKPSARDLAHA